VLQPTPSADAWTYGHLHGDTLDRPAPEGCLNGSSAPHKGVGTAAVRPPYLHPSCRQDPVLPAPVA